MFKISPDQTPKVVQELMSESWLPIREPRVCAFNGGGEGDQQKYRRSDALRAAGGICIGGDAGRAVEEHSKTRYVNDKQITDHYAIIPTGQGTRCAAKSPRVEP